MLQGGIEGRGVIRESEAKVYWWGTEGMLGGIGDRDVLRGMDTAVC